MSISLLESPSIIRRGDATIVLFPSRPYWFSATEEIVDILDAFTLGDAPVIIAAIAERLAISQEDAEIAYQETVDLLYPSGVLLVDGQRANVEDISPEFQVNDVENVLVIATTQGCNMACSMCYARAKKVLKNEMTTDEIKSIIDQLARMPWNNEVSRVALTGGELFTRKDALDLIDYVHQCGFYAQVNTNATLLTSEQIKKLAAYPRLKMSVSLDGCCAETHEAIRGIYNFEKTIQAISALTARGVSVAINMFVHAGNLDEIAGTIHLADALGVSGFNCLNMMHVGRGNSRRTKQELAAVPLAAFYRKVFEVIRGNERFQQLMMHSTFANQLMGIAGGVKSTTCGIGTNRALYVKADGSLYPCADTAVLQFRLGNLRSDSLEEIWERSSRLSELRSLNIDTLNTRCASCDVRYQCAGNCRGENFQTTKDLRSPHFKCVEIRDSILELMWILTEEPDLFRCKVESLHQSVGSPHATSA
ncbi:MAG: radical SAM protein [Patescibacteria group bacterium]